MTCPGIAPPNGQPAAILDVTGRAGGVWAASAVYAHGSWAGWCGGFVLGESRWRGMGAAAH